jgi:hypothetical protein
MATQFFGQAQQVAETILEAFRTGNMPQALAPIFIQHGDEDAIPCRKWSWLNQLLTVLAGTDDARGFRQWEEAGRKVKKGAKSFRILAPCKRSATREAADGAEEKYSYVYAFKAICVFRMEDTEGAPIATPSRAFVDSLPVVEVARHWGLHVGTYNGEKAAAKGKYRQRTSIALGVENLATWAHELIHAADDRLTPGGLVGGQDPTQEIVAEFGGAVLLEALGLDSDSDRGGCWEYVSAYAEHAKIEPITACMRLLNRTCEAVALILRAAAELQPAEAAAEATADNSATLAPAACDACQAAADDSAEVLADRCPTLAPAAYKREEHVAGGQLLLFA